MSARRDVGPYQACSLSVGGADEAVEGGGGEGALDEAVKDGGDGVGSHGMEIVEENDGAGLAGVKDALGDGGAAGLAPVLRIDRPVGDAQAHPRGDGALLFTKRAIRRAEPDGSDACVAGDGVLAAGELLFDGAVAHWGEAGVGVGVVGDVVALGDKAFGEVGVGVDLGADQEEGGAHIPFFQLVEDAIGHAGGWPVVEREGEFVAEARAGVNEGGVDLILARLDDDAILGAGGHGQTGTGRHEKPEKIVPPHRLPI